MKLVEPLKTLHKWLALLVGIQLIIWLVTGLYFNLSDRTLAKGNEYRIHVHQQDRIAEYSLLPVSSIHGRLPISVELIWIFHRPYYHFIYEEGQHSYQVRHSALFDAVSGLPYQLQGSQIRQMAKLSYSGPGDITSSRLVTPPFDDYVAQQNSMWRVDMDDDNNTAIYLDQITGKVLKHVNDDARLKHWMMKLHFMDYGNTGGFNHWLIVLFAVMTLLLSMTGVTWLLQQFKQGQLRLLWGQGYSTVAMTFHDGSVHGDVVANSGHTILDGLASANLSISSVCGGGGTCGSCLFKTSKSLPVTPAEAAKLSSRKLQQGYRLSCQHRMSDVDGLEIIVHKHVTNNRQV